MKNLLITGGMGFIGSNFIRYLLKINQEFTKNCPGMVVSSFLVEVAKVTGEEMQEWREKYPEAFARAYDPAYGLLFNAWVEGGK